MKKGFTLIELLVVIALIGILTTLVMANLNSGRSRSRDAQRKSDLRSIATALRIYYNDKNLYPDNNASGEIVGCSSLNSPQTCNWGEAWTASGNTYMNVLPADPLTGQSYKYESTDDDSFTLSACLENKSDDKGIATTDTNWCSSAWQYQVIQ